MAFPPVISFVSTLYITVQAQDSEQPQHSQDSPQPKGLGLTMVEMEEAVLAGIVVEMTVCSRYNAKGFDGGE
ncbi:hypothetical protein BU25DRAFT_413193 [Macroventuria anomochaeta]|uniref:Uncharacterized protein n=1 Tax=Macroventuria anomochaeta TaxID=301207 RepID=A0ACB6RRQ3_9PLEO|nr:uncharacterized protein BU25DRAFT_413193 [Macroventuria anomochaeta]KAF2624645.1 hypothetical protein BU25DRAFT_413193 [Macroventuria anomochaeta]